MLKRYLVKESRNPENIFAQKSAIALLSYIAGVGWGTVSISPTLALYSPRDFFQGRFSQNTMAAHTHNKKWRR